MKKDIVKNDDVKEVTIKDIPAPRLGLTLSFNFPPSFNLDLFEEECKKRDLPVSIGKESDIKGTVFVSCKSFDLSDNLVDIRKELSEPIKLAIKNTILEKEIKSSMIKTKYFRSVIKFIQDKYKEYHDNKVTKEEVENDVYLKYGHLLGREGAKKVANLFSENKDEIIDNYFKLQEYLIKHYSIEFFIYQQVEKNYFLIITIEENGTPLLNSPKILLPEKGIQIYEKKSITPPGFSTMTNVYITPDDKNSILIINPRKDNYTLVNKILSLKQVNNAILFMNFLLNKQKEGLLQDMENFKIDSMRLKSAILRYDSKTIDVTLNKIENLESILLSLQEEFILKIKKYCDEIDIEKKTIERETLSKAFDQKAKFGGEETGVVKFVPPRWFYTFSFVNDFLEFKSSVYFLYDNINLLLDKIRILKEGIIEYQHKIVIREKEKLEANRQIIFNSIHDIIKIIKAIFGQ